MFPIPKCLSTKKRIRLPRPGCQIVYFFTQAAQQQLPVRHHSEGDQGVRRITEPSSIPIPLGLSVTASRVPWSYQIPSLLSLMGISTVKNNIIQMRKREKIQLWRVCKLTWYRAVTFSRESTYIWTYRCKEKTELANVSDKQLGECIYIYMLTLEKYTYLSKGIWYFSFSTMKKQTCL